MVAFRYTQSLLMLLTDMVYNVMVLSAATYFNL